MAKRRQQGPAGMLGLIVLVVGAHALALTSYEALRPPPPAVLDLVLTGEGQGMVLSMPDGARCPGECTAKFDEPQEITLVATLGKNATFEGWSWPCRPDPEYILRCTVSVHRLHATTVTATFGVIPEAVEVSFVDDPSNEDENEDSALDITLPDTASVAKLLDKAPTPIEELMTEEPEPLIAKVEPVPPPDEPKKEKPKPEQLETYNLKAVEVPDENEVKAAPDDAQFLSDKNRDVAEETRARDTNLDKQSDGQQAFTEKSDVNSEEVGAKEDEIAETENTEASDLDVEKAPDSSKSGVDDSAKGALAGAGGAAGQGGQQGDGTTSNKPGVLSMRGIEGRGIPGGPVVPEETDKTDGGKPGRAGKRGRVGMKTNLEWNDFERIAGRERLEADMHTAQKKRSSRKGRFSGKLAAIRSSLENFNTEVREGNQTALKTRAAPFAVYIARMHRHIHKTWGFGFLEELNRRPATDAMNDWELWTKLEIIINPDGSVERVNIVRTSGLSIFDVAAVDVVLSGAPYDPTPEQIRSPDDKVYMHWKFHRDWRQCGTFGAQPFILAEAPKGKTGDRGGFTRGLPMPKVSRADREQAAQKSAEATARAAANTPSPDDPRAKFAAGLWLTGFTKGDLSKLAKVSAVPFSSAGRVVASNAAELRTMYTTVLSENSRSVQQSKLLSAAGYRKRFGNLPPGADLSPSDLFYVVRTAKEQFTLVLRLRGNEYQVIAFHR